MSNQNNLQTLNDTLFETLKGVKDGNISPVQAKVVNEIAGTIINNAKVQLDAIKVTKGIGRSADLFGVKGIAPATKEKDGDMYDRKLEFAESLGYKNVAEAVGKMQSWEFEKAFKVYIEETE